MTFAEAFHAAVAHGHDAHNADPAADIPRAPAHLTAAVKDGPLGDARAEAVHGAVTIGWWQAKWAATERERARLQRELEARS